MPAKDMPIRDITADLIGPKETSGPAPLGPDQGGIDITRDLFAPLPRMSREAAAAPSESDGSFGEAFGRFAADRYIKNLLGMGKLGIQGAEKLFSVSPEGPVKPLLPQNLSEYIPSDPGNMLRAAAGTAAEQAVRLLPESMRGGVEPGGMAESFSENLSMERERGAAMESEQPFAAGAGNVGGDVLTLLSARPPARALVSRARAALPKISLGAGQTGAGAFAKDVLLTAQKKLGPAVAVGAETGLETALLTALDDRDPTTPAIVGAGSRMAGAGLVHGFRTAPIHLTMAAFTAGGLVQLAKSAAPGGKDRILESMETGFDKVKWLLTLGMLSAVGGAGKFSTDGPLARRLPQAADALTSMRRGAVIGTYKELTRERDRGGDRTWRVLERFSEDPLAFGRAAGDRLGRAVMSETISVTDEIDRMVRSNPEFRKKVDALLGTE